MEKLSSVNVHHVTEQAGRQIAKVEYNAAKEVWVARIENRVAARAADMKMTIKKLIAKGVSSIICDPAIKKDVMTNVHQLKYHSKG